MATFYGLGSAVSSHYEESLLFTIKPPGVPGTHFIDFGRMKG